MGLAAEKYPNWPAAMNREWALAYTGVAETQLREWERSGKVKFRPRGPKNQMVALRDELDAAVHSLFRGIDFDDGPIEFD